MDCFKKLSLTAVLFACLYPALNYSAVSISKGAGQRSRYTPFEIAAGVGQLSSGAQFLDVDLTIGRYWSNDLFSPSLYLIYDDRRMLDKSLSTADGRLLSAGGDVAYNLSAINKVVLEYYFNYEQARTDVGQGYSFYQKYHSVIAKSEYGFSAGIVELQLPYEHYFYDDKSTASTISVIVGFSPAFDSDFFSLSTYVEYGRSDELYEYVNSSADYNIYSYLQFNFADRFVFAPYVEYYIHRNELDDYSYNYMKTGSDLHYYLKNFTGARSTVSLFRERSWYLDGNNVRDYEMALTFTFEME